ncbi:MAG: aminotransferase class I/II-fold pyridoxal phosphate-dependent enzyme [Bacteroidetes bacterium]|jgi:1-aminocyclopropane-1-carboxylate synthase|nr:aminotransferase class I/II-fold pyridoxal phosphate-dependent enzyme [Bacteroidota bacterium]
MALDKTTIISSLSNRGAPLAATSARVDMELFMEAAQNLYDPEANPSGAFPLNVAENALMIPFLKEYLDGVLEKGRIPEWAFQYTDPKGHPEVREAVAHFMEKYLCKCPIAPDSIAFSAGAAASIETSTFMLADEGDVVVIPAPSYPMYTNDIGLKSGLQRYDLQTHYHPADHGDISPLTTKHLDEAWAYLNSKGAAFKILLLTSPDNPTGCMYSERQLRDFAQWCIEREVHLVVSEIYGLSLIDIEDEAIRGEYTPATVPHSFAQIMADCQSDYLHLWYALSKDFAMSGFRFGIVHSLNEAFLKGLGNVNIPHMVSNLNQWLIGEMMKDHAFLARYIERNKQQLTQSYKAVVRALHKMDAPYVPSRGSLFVWADFSKYLKSEDQQGEEALWMDIYHNTGVLLTPGTGFQHEKYGLFRIVYTALPLSHLEVAMDRLLTYFKGGL